MIVSMYAAPWLLSESCRFQIRLAVVSTLHLLNPLPAHPPESIETLIETLRQDDDREVRTVAKSE